MPIPGTRTITERLRLYSSQGEKREPQPNLEMEQSESTDDVSQSNCHSRHSFLRQARARSLICIWVSPLPSERVALLPCLMCALACGFCQLLISTQNQSQWTLYCFIFHLKIHIWVTFFYYLQANIKFWSQFQDKYLMDIATRLWICIEVTHCNLNLALTLVRVIHHLTDFYCIQTVIWYMYCFFFRLCCRAEHAKFKIESLSIVFVAGWFERTRQNS